MLVYDNSLSPFLWFSWQWNLHLQYERFEVTSHIVISLHSQFIQESLHTLIPDRFRWNDKSSEMMTIWRRFRTFYTHSMLDVYVNHISWQDSYEDVVVERPEKGIAEDIISLSSRFTQESVVHSTWVDFGEMAPEWDDDRDRCLFCVTFSQVFDIWDAKTSTKRMHIDWHAQLRTWHVAWLVKKTTTREWTC